MGPYSLALSHTARRITSFALFALIALGACASVAKQVEAASDACCGSATSDAADPPPCHGFLPLTCCQNAALPGSEPHPTPPQLAIGIVPMAAAPPLVSAIAMPCGSLTARTPPPRSTIVLQL